MPSKQKEYDVLIVGSGHAGGMAARTLTAKGISCLMLEGGPNPDLAKDRKTLEVDEQPYRGLRPPGIIDDPSIREGNANGFVNTKEIPYTYDAGKPFVWTRVRLVGGRSIFWARQCFRLSDLEFKAKDFDGFDANWPIDLAELSPYYDRVEQLYRVSGRKEGLPQYPDGNFVETRPAPDSPLIRHLTPFATKLGMTFVAGRGAEGVNGLASSINLTLPDALATGNLTIVPNAVVREISLDKNTGLAGEVHFVERHTRREMSAKARVIVLAASALESTRILLNSNIANSSGVLGHYLHDQFYAGTCYAETPEVMVAGGGGGSYIAPFRNVSDATRAKNFIRRYVLQIGAGRLGPDQLGLYGTELQEKLKEYDGRIVGGSVVAESLPRFENHVRINKEVKDPWGIPVLHISDAYGENERNLHQDAQDQNAQLYEDAGFKIYLKNKAFADPGQHIHEVGTARMGDDPKTSVLNKWNQSHDIKNLFIMDGSCFVSSGWQNPTLTIVALSLRASEHLADELRQGNL